MKALSKRSTNTSQDTSSLRALDLARLEAVRGGADTRTVKYGPVITVKPKG